MDNINIIQSDKFKNNAISLVIPLDLDDKVTIYNLLAALLKRGSRKYPTTKAIWEHLQDLYGAVFDIVVTKKGEKLFLNFYIQCIDDSFALKGEKLLEQALDFLDEIVNNPLMSEGGFEQSYFETEKENLKVLINSRLDNKDSYALERMEEILTEGEPYSIYKYGNIERLEVIKNIDLPKIWEDIRSKSNSLLLACGNIEKESIKNRANNLIKNTCKEVVVPSTAFKSGIKEVVETMEVNQSKLCLGCRTNTTIFNGDYFAFSVMNSILGGGTHSKLFNEVREKNSLAYYSYSFIEKFKGLLIIACGIDHNNYEKAKNICIEQINAIKNGNISSEELYSAKKKLISDLRTITDSQYSLMDYISALRAYGIQYNLEDVIAGLEKVDIERVIECAKTIELNAVYFMTKQ
ncbi:EF-P 5-aminopentanol modification-associated protein YfmF [Clostridium thermarum]|uniref:EF-P 5-aminopentanol modification-associated protein YfmF n=1 Tax=Clostridium thermarum TaxID=1716543 RepID=UPI0013D1DFCD|nr:pitrilysin family protein [Clostridium thermarum]